MAYGPQPASATGPCKGQENHTMAERKRREKINKRFIQLSTLVPGLKKLNRTTILSDATRYVEELQQKIKALQESVSATGGNSMSSSSSGRNPLPEIEVQFSVKSVMLRIICGDAQGVLVRVLSEVEEGLCLSIIHANTMRTTACTIIVDITAEVYEGFTLTGEEIIDRLNSALEQQISCTSTEEK